MKITMLTNGPLLLDGECALVDQNGRTYSVTKDGPLALCRCGASRKKPLCDGTHAQIAFSAPPQPPR